MWQLPTFQEDPVVFITCRWSRYLYGGLGLVVAAGLAGCSDRSPVSLDTVSSTAPSPGETVTSTPASSPAEERSPTASSAVPTASSTRIIGAGAQGQLKVAADFLRRVPAAVRTGGCRPAVTVTTPAVPYVECDQPSTGRTVIFRIYPDAASMNANFDENLYANVPSDSSDCSTPRHTSTYRSGSTGDACSASSRPPAGTA